MRSLETLPGRVVTVMIFTCFVGLAGVATAQTVYYVDASVAVSGDGSITHPFKTINEGVDEADQTAGAVEVRILPGNYDGPHEASEGGFPIDLVRSDLTVTGAFVDPALWPRVGGRVAATGASALFRLEASAATLPLDDALQNVIVQQIEFMGDDVVGFDSPSAVEAVATDEKSIETSCELRDTICRRGVMNASGSAGRPTIAFHADAAGVNIGVRDNYIETSARGGIQTTVATDAFEDASSRVTIERNTITTRDGESALFGILWDGTDIDPRSGSTNGYAGINDNRITGSWDGSDPNEGMLHGLEVICPPGSNYGQSQFERNVVTGCRSDAVVLRADGTAAVASTPNITMNAFEGNRIARNGGSGVVLWWDETNHAVDKGAGYIFPSFRNNLIVANSGYGIELRGLGELSAGTVGFLCDTIADNRSGGEGYFDLELGADPVSAFLNTVSFHDNVIMWDNASGGAQVSGLDAPVLAALHGVVRYSDWQHIVTPSCNPVVPDPVTGNISCDPVFVDPSVVDYHLRPVSPCIDRGDPNLQDPPEADIDGESRIEDGDYDCVGEPDPIVDMGADEVPQPSCGT